MPFALQFLDGDLRLAEDVFETGRSRDDIHGVTVDTVILPKAFPKNLMFSSQLTLDLEELILQFRAVGVFCWKCGEDLVEEQPVVQEFPAQLQVAVQVCQSPLLLFPQILRRLRHFESPFYPEVILPNPTVL